jgi:chemotaxis-related protein WspB
MLFLIFQLGAERYALAARQVVEVLPLLQFRPLPQAVPGIAGIFSYHGTLVPLIDLVALVLGQPASRRMSTRIITVGVQFAGEEETHLLGLMAEKTTETLRREESDFVEAGVAVEATPYLGPVTSDERGLIQRVEVEQLLSEEVRELLFQQMSREAPCP